jgi:hypothetical protein
VALLKTDPTAEVTAHAAAALRNLARGNAQNRDAMREAGAIAPLVALLGAGPKNEATSHACAALANLTFDNVLNQDAVRDAGGVRPLMALLGTSSDLTTYATGALANGACGHHDDCAASAHLTRFRAQWRTRWWRCLACCSTLACRWRPCCARRARPPWRSPPRPPRLLRRECTPANMCIIKHAWLPFTPLPQQRSAPREAPPALAPAVPTPRTPRRRRRRRGRLRSLPWRQPHQPPARCATQCLATRWRARSAKARSARCSSSATRVAAALCLR